MTIESQSTAIRDDRRDLGLLGGVEGVVDQLLEDDQQPFIGAVAGLVDEFALAAELHQAGDLEGDAGEFRLALRLRLAAGGGPLGPRALRPGVATICKKLGSWATLLAGSKLASARGKQDPPRIVTSSPGGLAAAMLASHQPHARLLWAMTHRSG